MPVLKRALFLRLFEALSPMQPSVPLPANVAEMSKIIFMSEFSAHCHKAFERCLGAKQAGIKRIATSFLSRWWGVAVGTR